MVKPEPDMFTALAAPERVTVDEPKEIERIAVPVERNVFDVILKLPLLKSPPLTLKLFTVIALPRVQPPPTLVKRRLTDAKETPFDVNVFPVVVADILIAAPLVAEKAKLAAGKVKEP